MTLPTARVPVSVVVVSWNTRDLTLACLAAARSALSGLAAATGWGGQLVLVDNGSSDGTVEAVRAARTDVEVVALTRNLGFSGGVNAGLSAARGDIVCLLNTDARLEAGALVTCVAHLDAHPRTGIVGPRLLHADGRPQRSADAFPSLASELVPGWLVDAVTPWRRPAQRVVGGRRPLRVDALRGAALFVRRAVFDAVGPLDAGYFFYLEETDLCWRAARAGFGVELLPEATVVHASGASSKRVDPIASRIEYHRSLYRFLRLRRGPWTMRVAACARTGRNAVTVLALAVAAPFSAAARRRLRERAALLAWHLRGRPAHPSLAGPAHAAVARDALGTG